MKETVLMNLKGSTFRITLVAKAEVENPTWIVEGMPGAFPTLIDAMDAVKNLSSTGSVTSP